MNRLIKIIVYYFLLYAGNSWAFTDTTQILESTNKFAEFIIKNELSKQKNYYFQFNGYIGKENLNGGKEMMPQDADYTKAIKNLTDYNAKRSDKKAIYIFHGRYYFSQRFYYENPKEEEDSIQDIGVGAYKDSDKKFFKQVIKPLKSSKNREKIKFIKTEQLNARIFKAIRQQNPNVNIEEIVIGFIVEEYVADFGLIPTDVQISSLTPKITQNTKIFFSYFKITPPFQIFALNEEIPVSPFTPTNETSPVYSKALLEVSTFLTKATWQDASREVFNDVFDWIKRLQTIERENKLVEASLKEEFKKISDKRERFITWSRAKEGLLAFARFLESLKGNYEGTGFAFTSENPEDWASNPNIPRGNAIFVEASAIVALQATMTSLGYSNAISFDGKTLKIDPTKIPKSARTLREEAVRKAYEEVIDPLSERFSKEEKLLVLERRLRQIGSTWESVRVCGVQRLEGQNNANTPTDGILKGNINLLKDYPQVDTEAYNLKIVFYFAQKTNAQGQTYNPNKTYLLLGFTDYDLVIDILDKIIDKKGQEPNNCKITEEDANSNSLISFLRQLPELNYSGLSQISQISFNKQDDVVDVIVHYFNGGYQLWVDDKSIMVDEITLASKIIERVPQGFKKIRLLSCSDLESAKKVSRALPGYFELYATNDIVRLHSDGRITTIARSGNATKKWRILKAGKDVDKAPTPEEPKGDAIDNYVQLGSSLSINDFDSTLNPAFVAPFEIDGFPFVQYEQKAVVAWYRINGKANGLTFLRKYRKLSNMIDPSLSPAGQPKFVSNWLTTSLFDQNIDKLEDVLKLIHPSINTTNKFSVTQKNVLDKMVAYVGGTNNSTQFNDLLTNIGTHKSKFTNESINISLKPAIFAFPAGSPNNPFDDINIQHIMDKHTTKYFEATPFNMDGANKSKIVDFFPPNTTQTQVCSLLDEAIEEVKNRYFSGTLPTKTQMNTIYNGSWAENVRLSNGQTYRIGFTTSSEFYIGKRLDNNYPFKGSSPSNNKYIIGQFYPVGSSDRFNLLFAEILSLIP
jgi:hypothetical protein